MKTARASCISACSRALRIRIEFRKPNTSKRPLRVGLRRSRSAIGPSHGNSAKLNPRHPGAPRSGALVRFRCRNRSRPGAGAGLERTGSFRSSGGSPAAGSNSGGWSTRTRAVPWQVRLVCNESRPRASTTPRHVPCSQMQSASMYKAVKPDREQGMIGELQGSNDESSYR